MSVEQDRAFFRNFVVVVLGLSVVGVGAAMLGRMFGDIEPHSEERARLLSEQFAPVGQVYVAGRDTPPEPVAVEAVEEVSVAAVETDPGAEVYQGACAACHGAGVGGAPRTGDTADWGVRYEQGFEVLADHAINGYQGAKGMMPAKGGRSDLSDDQVKAAIWYMLAEAGIDNPDAAAAEPAADSAEAPSPAPAEASADAEPAAAEAVLITVSSERAEAGEAIYNQACMACHTPGAAGAPKLGDAAAWEARIAKGQATLYDHAVNGFMGQAGMMPAKGGRPDLADDDVHAAVDFMVYSVQ